jgi:hypothetical protein
MPRRRWFTPAEDHILLGHAGTMAAVATQLNRSATACRCRKRLLLAGEPARRPFTTNEDDQIRRGDLSVTALAEIFGRRRSTVTNRFKQLGTVSQNPRKRAFTAGEDAVILASPHKSHSELARILDRDRSSVRKRRKAISEQQ